MKEKVLFFDIDGTLVCSQMGIYEIPLGVKQQLNRLKETRNINSLFVVEDPKPC